MHHLTCSVIYMPHANCLKTLSKSSRYDRLGKHVQKYTAQLARKGAALGNKDTYLLPVIISFLQFVEYLKI